MSSVSSLLIFIHSKLVELSGKQVFQDKPPAPEDTVEPVVYPYIVYSLTIPDREVEQDRGILEIDFWDNSTKIAVFEALVTSVDGDGSKDNPTGLNELKYFSNGLQAVFYREFRGSVPDPDPKIRRRQLRYLARIRFIREGE
jgi:hypothetical protein